MRQLSCSWLDIARTVNMETNRENSNRFLLGAILMGLPVLCLMASNFLKPAPGDGGSNTSTALFVISMFPGVAFFLFGLFITMFAIVEKLGWYKKPD